MKVCALILALVLGLLCFGCGEEGETVTTEQEARDSQEPKPAGAGDFEGAPTVSSRNDPRFAEVSIEGRHAPLIDPADRPPPKELLVRDLRVGSGPAADWGDLASLRYHGVMYETGKVWFRGWNYPPSIEIPLGSRGTGPGFEKGIVGMRPGGRRELVIPGPLAIGFEPVDYVVELVRLEPAKKPPRGN